MSGFSLPVSRPAGHALLIGAPEGRAPAAAHLSALHFTFDEADDPYSGFARWCGDPEAYSAVALCLGGLYQEELGLIAAIKRIQPGIDVWLAQTDGRHAAMAAAIGLGADGLLSEAGLHRIALTSRTTSSDIDHSSPASQSVKDLEGAEAAADRSGDSAHHGAKPAIAEMAEQDDESFCSGMASTEPLLTAEELSALLEEPALAPRGDGH